MRRIHFIAIGGAAMHNLAITLKNKGYNITGSDDEIFEPSLSRLKSHGLLPHIWGWDTSRIDTDIDAVILGMHADKDNPELIRAIDLGIRIYSYPEFLYEQTRSKTRIVIAGSHGKTTITAMVIHVLRASKIKFDFMVGSQIEGIETMVSLSEDSKIAVFEGDEYLSSPLDHRPKFLHYKPHIALISGIAWDHVNVFPTFESYIEQFRRLCEIIPPGGHLVYYENDKILSSVVEATKEAVNRHPYKEHPNEVINEVTYLKVAGNQKIKLNVFGIHNIQNICGAMILSKLAGIDDQEFYSAIAKYTGTARRLQILKKTADSIVFYDFAHSPSKVKATVTAVKNQFPNRELIAVLELHTYSSLNKNFIPQYAGSLNYADRAVIYYDPHVIKIKGLEMISKDNIKDYFRLKTLIIYSDNGRLEKYFRALDKRNTVLLFMSSGNFGGLNIKEIFE